MARGERKGEVDYEVIKLSFAGKVWNIEVAHYLTKDNRN